MTEFFADDENKHFYLYENDNLPCTLQVDENYPEINKKSCQDNLQDLRKEETTSFFSEGYYMQSPYHHITTSEENAVSQSTVIIASTCSQENLNQNPKPINFRPFNDKKIDDRDDGIRKKIKTAFLKYVIKCANWHLNAYYKENRLRFGLFPQKFTQDPKIGINQKAMGLCLYELFQVDFGGKEDKLETNVNVIKRLKSKYAHLFECDDFLMKTLGDMFGDYLHSDDYLANYEKIEKKISDKEYKKKYRHLSASFRSYYIEGKPNQIISTNEKKKKKNLHSSKFAVSQIR